MLEAPSHDGFKILLAIIVLFCLGALMIALIRPLSEESTLRAQAQSAAQIAAERERTARAEVQSAAEIAAAQERTERERLGAATQQQSAMFRAEAARTTNMLGIIAAAGGAVLLGLLILAFFVFGMNWAEGKQLQRTLLLIEAQREARMMLRQPDAGEIMLLASAQTSSREVYTHEH